MLDCMKNVIGPLVRHCQVSVKVPEQVDVNETKFCWDPVSVRPQPLGLTELNVPVPPPVGVGPPTHTVGPPVPQTLMISPTATPVSVTVMLLCPPVTVMDAA